MADAGDADSLPAGVMPWVADPLDTRDLRHLRRRALLSAEQSAFTARELERYVASYDALRDEHLDRYVDLFERVQDIPYRRPPGGDLGKFHALRDSIQRDIAALDDVYFASIADSLTDEQRTRLEQCRQRRIRDRLCSDALVRAWFVGGRPTEIRDLLSIETRDPQVASQLELIVTAHERGVTQLLEKLARRANATRTAWLDVVGETGFESIVRDERQATPELREMHRVTAYAWRDAVGAARPLLDEYDAQVTATLDRLDAVLPDEAMTSVRSQWTRLEYDADRREPLLAALTEADLERAKVAPDVRERVLPRLRQYRQKLAAVEAEAAAARRAEHARTMPLSTFARDVVDDERRVSAMRSSRMLDIERVRLYDDLRAWLGPDTVETLRIATRERIESAGTPNVDRSTATLRPMRLDPPEFATAMELLPRHPHRSFLSACARELRLDAGQVDSLREKLATGESFTALVAVYEQLGRVELRPEPREATDGRRVRVLPSPDVVTSAAKLIEQAQSALGEHEAYVIAALSQRGLVGDASRLDGLRSRLSTERVMPGLMRGLSPDAPGDSLLNLSDLLETAQLSTEDRVKALAVVDSHVDSIVQRQRACWEATLALWKLQQLAMIERAPAQRDEPTTDAARRLEDATRELASCHELAATANRQILDEIADAISPAGGEAVRRRFRLLSFPEPARWERGMDAALLRAHALVSQHEPDGSSVETIGEYIVVRREDAARLANDWRTILAQMATDEASAPNRDHRLRLALVLQQNELSRRELESMIRLELENRLGAESLNAF